MLKGAYRYKRHGRGDVPCASPAPSSAQGPKILKMMDETCQECGYDYATLDTAQVPDMLRREATSLSEVVATVHQSETSPSGSWTTLEYAGHVRDVLLVARERTLGTLLQEGFRVTPMSRDERVALGEYDSLSPRQAADEIILTAGWLAYSWERLAEHDWQRVMLYNYPESEQRSLSWLAAHIIHEVVHHRQDIKRLECAQ